jgi:hypothetical protein
MVSSVPLKSPDIKSVEYFYQFVAVGDLDEFNLILPLFRPAAVFRFLFLNQKNNFFFVM